MSAQRKISCILHTKGKFNKMGTFIPKCTVASQPYAFLAQEDLFTYEATLNVNRVKLPGGQNDTTESMTRQRHKLCLTIVYLGEEML